MSEEVIEEVIKILERCLGRYTKFALKQLSAETVIMQNSQDIAIALAKLANLP